ncbi:MAG: 3-hydroxybutyryl-CoA dehydrogenase [Deltaproteobacteria bacterium]|nr:3-hydroxybutyryl-CoA dehydrogenase [Deltaproteobacteria bacterium]
MIERIGVLGAGQMGRGIAQVAAQAGHGVVLADATGPLAQAGKETIASALGKLVDKGKLGGPERDAIVSRISTGVGAESLCKVDFAIEAVSEEESLKLGLFRKLDLAVPRGAILASNTSSIPITKIAAATTRPEKVIGMHFMNPVPLMKLVEVVRGLQTDDETWQVTCDLAAKLGKTTITTKDSPGFIVNRILVPLLNEACFALQEGLASADDIDKGIHLGLNHPMGPLALADLIGLDTYLYIADVMHRELGDDKYRPPTILRNYVAAGWLGRKTGRGFYRYS